MSTVTLTMLAETSSMSRGIRTTESQLGALGRTTSGFGSAFRKAFLIAGAAVAASKVKDFLGDCISEGRESNKVLAQTNAVLKSTGHAAGISAKQIGDLANGLSVKTGIDDEAIQSGENVLLTFTNVRNEVGKGNDIFNKATGIALDMSAALGTDLKGANIQLGKALNDPVKGISALSRVGVSFTQQQKDQVAAMVKTGNTLGAQKIVLGEVTKEFGGSAAAIATPGAKLAVVVGNIKEQIGLALIPILDKLETYLVKNLPKWIDKAKEAFATIKPYLIATGLVIKALISGLVSAFKFIAPYIGQAITAVAGFIQGLQSGQGTAGGFGAYITQKIVPAVLGIVSAFKGFIAAVIPIIVQVVAAIRSNWSQIAPYVTQAFNSVKSIVLDVMSIIQSNIRITTKVITVIWNKWGKDIAGFAAKYLGNAVKVISGALKIIAGIFKVVSNVLKGNWSGAWAGIKEIVAGAWQVIKGVVSNGVLLIKSILKGGLAVLKVLAAKAWDGVKAAFKAGLSAAIAEAKKLPGQVLTAIGNLDRVLYDAGTKLIQGLIDGIGDMFGKVQGKLGDLTGKLTSWKGPPKRDAVLLKPAGILIIKGFIDGLTQGFDDVKTTLGKVTDYITQHFAKLLDKEKAALTKRLKAHKESSKQIAKAIAALTTANGKQVKEALDSIKDEVAAVKSKAKAYDVLAKALANAKANAKAALQTMKDYAASVTSNAVGFGSITSSNAAFNADSLTASLQAKVAQVQKFTALLGQLAKLGLNKTTYDQIVQAGPDGGYAYALALVQGGKAAIGQYNTAQAQLNTAAGALGTSTSQNLYAAGVKAAQGLVKGLQSQLKALKAVAIKLANELADAIEKALGKRGIGKDGKTIATKTPRVAIAGNTGGTGNTSPSINLTVNAGLGTNGADVGKQIEKELNKWLLKNYGRKLATV